jgi:glycosyltransferase involved in cell wall biosynthesis
MTITCLMSTYIKDNQEFLIQAIESILSQTRLPDEFLIVKDGRLDEKKEDILSKYEKEHDFIHVIGYEENKGLGYALAYGVSHATGEVIARMDSDDISDENRLRIEEEYLLAHPEIRLLGSNTNEFMDNINNTISQRNMPENNDDIIAYSKKRNPFIHPSICFYKEDALKVGNYESWYLCEDYDLWAKLLKSGVKAYNIQQNLVHMRISNDFYKRRGGVKYCHNILKFKRHLRKTKYITHLQYIKTATPSLVSSLMPNFAREFLYKKLLRSKKKNG